MGKCLLCLFVVGLISGCIGFFKPTYNGIKAMPVEDVLVGYWGAVWTDQFGQKSLIYLSIKESGHVLSCSSTTGSGHPLKVIPGEEKLELITETDVRYPFELTLGRLYFEGWQSFRKVGEVDPYCRAFYHKKDFEWRSEFQKKQ
ncbi:hypothetical protein [Vibrio barjaei]|uniref:hypothetical protein n=1 Tax=Vibrio barjaei TaxID=1676683 RepID=UPI0022839FF6|nr:hypothetical protein [Vibrio barjaei]MCY9874518.1 hypothetical protein [Vibrio barjaei]